MAAAGLRLTKRVSVFSEPDSGVEDPTRAIGRGQGRRRGREKPESASARPGATAPALSAVRPGLGCSRALSAASLVFLVGPGALGQALSCSWASLNYR